MKVLSEIINNLFHFSILDICPDGTQFAAADECEDCPIGLYRKANVQESCVPCPTDRVTAHVKSVTMDECTVRKYYQLFRCIHDLTSHNHNQ